MHNDKIAATYDYYTLDQARQIIAEEKAKRKAELIYHIKQKFIGLLMIVISIIIPAINDGDATVSLITLPIGIYLILTREKAIVP